MELPYCPTLVRTQDPDRFLISLFYTGETRSHLWSLYALNHEIAKTREVVTDTTIGLIRLQWWRDALTAFYERNEVLKNDVIEGLSQAIWRYNLPREVFEQMIYAREFDLEDQAPGSLQGLCNYADYTHTPLLRLGVMIADEDPDHPALQPVAMAYALAGMIRSVPFHARQGRCMLPDDLMRRHGLSLQDMHKPDKRADLCAVVASVRACAEDALHQGKGAKSPSGLLIRLHKVITEQYLNKIKALGDDPFDPRLTVPPAFRGVRLWMTARKIKTLEKNACYT